MRVLTQSAQSFGIILNVPTKVNFTKLGTAKSVLFEWLGLKEMFSLNED